MVTFRGEPDAPRPSPTPGQAVAAPREMAHRAACNGGAHARVYPCRAITAVDADWRVAMFSVLFEVQPRRDEWDVYLARADMRRADLEQTPGFVDNIHYSSLTRDGWILSLSGWRDEDSILRWHARMRDNEAGSRQILPDFRLRVGEVTSDTALPEGQKIVERRPDDTE